jgi:nucleotide-binding universal stress UspA family protein
MFGKLIVGYDGSEQSRDALALARVLADPSGGKVIAACVYSYEPVYSKGGGDDYTYGEALRADAERVLASAEGASERRAVPGTSPAHAIHGLAEAEEADLIVVGSTHHGAVGKVLIGGVGEKLLHGSPCPVAVAPKGFAAAPAVEIRKIAVAYNGAPESERALALATRVAIESGGTLQLYTAVEAPVASKSIFPSDYGLPRHSEALFVRAQEQLDAAVAQLPQQLAARGDLISGPASEALANETRQHTDLLVMGSRGYGPLRGVILGRVSADLARSAPCPLIVVPRGSGVPAEEGPAPQATVTSVSGS